MNVEVRATRKPGRYTKPETNMTSSNPRSAEVVELPDWTIPSNADVDGFFSALALADLEGGWIRLSAATQKAFFGCAQFGKRAIKSDGMSLKVYRSMCFGTDGECMSYTPAELAAFVTKINFNRNPNTK